MGLRCLIGHDYDEPETIRDREERGDEMVVSVREYKECARCGHRRVIAENKEVRSIEPDPASPPDDDEPGGGATTDPTAAAGASDHPSPGDAADDGDREDEYDDLSAEEDDGVILPDEPDREPGEWPETDDRGDEEPVEHEDWPDAGGQAPEPAPAEHEHEEWPAAAGEDEGFDAGPADGAPADDVEFRGGLTPERAPRSANAADGSADGAADADADADADSASSDGPTVEAAPASGGSSALGSMSGDDAAPVGIRSADSEPTGRLADVDTEYACPECGHAVPTSESSLRPGDICPECQRGYLTEREQSSEGRNP